MLVKRGCKIFGVVAVSLLLSLPCIAHADRKANAMLKMQKTYPNTKIDQFTEAPFDGLYEIVADEQIFYFDPETGYLFFGEIYTPEGNSLTNEKREKIRLSRLSKLPLDKAIKIGNGSKKIIAFLDPDDSFSREVESYLSKRADVTQYVYLFPKPQFHSTSIAKSEFILSSKDHEKAFMDVFKGLFDETHVPSSGSAETQKHLDEVAEVAKRMKVSGVPTLWVEGQFIRGGNIPLIASILDGRREVDSKKNNLVNN